MNALPETIAFRRIPPEGTHELRRLVLRNGDPAALVEWPEDRVPGAFHMAAWHAGAAVAIASVIPEPFTAMPMHVAYRLRGMATHPQLQGRGVGRALLLHLLDELASEGCGLLWCNARDGALPFYAGLGFQVFGGGFNIEGIGPHHVMWRKVGA